MKIYAYSRYDGGIEEKEVESVKNGRYYYMLGGKQTWSNMNGTYTTYYETREEAIMHGIRYCENGISAAKAEIRDYEEMLNKLNSLK